MADIKIQYEFKVDGKRYGSAITVSKDGSYKEHAERIKLLAKNAYDTLEHVLHGPADSPEEVEDISEYKNSDQGKRDSAWFDA